jgi:adenylate kinase family enzyme
MKQNTHIVNFNSRKRREKTESCIFDLNTIYNAKYKYYFPKKTLERYLSGKAIDHKKEYTLKEQHDLKADILDIYHKVISDNSNPTSVDEHVAIITAGAPGAGKTTLIQQVIKKNKLKGIHYSYICSSDVCLKNQTRTYKNELENSNKSLVSRQNIFNKWNTGSKAATHLILGNLIRKNVSFYFGTTSTSPMSRKFFQFLKKNGYKIQLIYVATPTETRWESVHERNKTFAQTTAKDVTKRGELLPQRLNDTFLSYADEITFYYRNKVHDHANLAALWTRNPTDSTKLGTLQIFSPYRYNKIKNIHNETIQALNRHDLDWKTSLEDRSRILRINKKKQNYSNKF